MEQKKTKALSFRTMAAYVSGTLGSTLITCIAGSFIAYYLTDILKISPAREGTTVMIGSILAIVVSLLFGVILDRTTSKRGKGSIWMRRLIIPFIFFSIALYVVPEDLSENTKFIWATVLYIFYISLTNAYRAAYQAVAPNLTKDPKSRGTMSMYNMVSSMLVGILVNNYLLGLVEKMGGGHKGFLYVAILFVGAGAIFSLICIFTTKEDMTEAQVTVKRVRTRPLKEDIKGLLANKYWMIMTLAGVAFSCWFGSFMGSQSFFAIYVLKDPSKIGLLFTASTIPGIVSMFVFAPIMAKFGRRKVILATGAVSMIGFLIMIFGLNNFSVFFVGMVLRGFCAGPFQGCEVGLMNNTVEYGEWKNGFRQEGMIATVSSTIKSLSASIMGGCVGFILAATGYVAGAEQSASAIFGIKLLYLYLPMLFCAITYICIFFYHLEEEYPVILTELRKRKEKA